MSIVRRMISMAVILAALTAAAGKARADLAVAGAFGVQMVVPRDEPVHVWVTTVAGEPVTVEFAGQLKSATGTPPVRDSLLSIPFLAMPPGRH